MSLATAVGVLRVGRISFLNTLPFFNSFNGFNSRLGPSAHVLGLQVGSETGGFASSGPGLARGPQPQYSPGLQAPGEWPSGARSLDSDCKFKFLDGTPNEINQAMEKGEIDVGLTSSLAYALLRDDLLIFPGLCIGATQRSRSVTLFSRDPIERLNGQTIAVSGKSLSASTLLKIVLQFRWGFQNEFEVSFLPSDEMLERYKTCLLIGDEALRFKPVPAHSYDLSDMWWEWTGYPFCFALWTVRRSSFERDPLLVMDFFQDLSQNLDRNLEHLGDLIDSVPLANTPREMITEYLKSLEYRFTDSMGKGLCLFFQYAHRLGLIPRQVPLHYVGVSLQKPPLKGKERGSDVNR